MNLHFQSLIKFLATKLCESRAYSPKKAGFTDYLNWVSGLLTKVDQPDSIYHIISQKDAIDIITNDIFCKFPNAKEMAVTDKSIFDNTIVANLTMYYAEYESGTVVPPADDPVTDNEGDITTPEEDDTTPTGPTGSGETMEEEEGSW